jgi:hypothetical protein
VEHVQLGPIGRASLNLLTDGDGDRRRDRLASCTWRRRQNLF